MRRVATAMIASRVSRPSRRRVEAAFTGLIPVIIRLYRLVGTDPNAPHHPPSSQVTGRPGTLDVPVGPNASIATTRRDTPRPRVRPGTPPAAMAPRPRATYVLKA